MNVMPKQLLLINPNTSGEVTERLLAHARSELPSGWTVHGVTARFGARYIACEASYAVAGHAALDAFAWAVAEHGGKPFDGVLIGCFGDPGLWALSECSPTPVVGLATASFELAARTGRFSVVTGGERWTPILRRLALESGHAGRLADIRTVSLSGAELAAQPARALNLLAQAGQASLASHPADAVVLGGAALAGMGQPLAERLGITVMDSVTAGVRLLVEKVSQHAPTDASVRSHAIWSHVAPELAALSAR